MVAHIGGTAIGIAVTGKIEKPGDRSGLFFEQCAAPVGFGLRPERRTFERAARPFAVARVFERGDEIFIALASEFFLGGFEACHARCDLVALARQPVVLFTHIHPF